VGPKYLSLLQLLSSHSISNAPVSMKPLLLKRGMRCDWATTLSMFWKCHTPYHTLHFQHTYELNQVLVNFFSCILMMNNPQMRIIVMCTFPEENSRRLREFKNCTQWYREYFPLLCNFAAVFHAQTATLLSKESWKCKRKKKA